MQVLLLVCLYGAAEHKPCVPRWLPFPISSAHRSMHAWRVTPYKLGAYTNSEILLCMTCSLLQAKDKSTGQGPVNLTVTFTPTAPTTDTNTPATTNTNNQHTTTPTTTSNASSPPSSEPGKEAAATSASPQHEDQASDGSAPTKSEEAQGESAQSQLPQKLSETVDIGELYQLLKKHNEWQKSVATRLNEQMSKVQVCMACNTLNTHV